MYVEQQIHSNALHVRDLMKKLSVLKCKENYEYCSFRSTWSPNMHDNYAN